MVQVEYLAFFFVFLFFSDCDYDSPPPHFQQFDYDASGHRFLGFILFGVC